MSVQQLPEQDVDPVARLRSLAAWPLPDELRPRPRAQLEALAATAAAIAEQIQAAQHPCALNDLALQGRRALLDQLQRARSSLGVDAAGADLRELLRQVEDLAVALPRIVHSPSRSARPAPRSRHAEASR